MNNQTMSAEDRGHIEALVRATHSDPFSYLGPHKDDEGHIVRAYLPRALSVELIDADSTQSLGMMSQDLAPGIFTRRVAQLKHYYYRILWGDGAQETEDSYAFAPLLGDMDLYLFAEGNHREMGQVFGAQLTTHEGIAGVRFAVWAPNAQRISVVGNFNSWDGRRHPMRVRYPSGVWELFIPRLQAGEVYKYEILDCNGTVTLKADPLALATEHPPATGSVVSAPLNFEWHDQEWMNQRKRADVYHQAISVYEVHVGSWRRGWSENPILNWQEFGDQLIPYVLEMGFTHVELMPIMEHPFGGSWGYQLLSQFAPSARYGSPKDFAKFVDRCHQAGIGVILDWVPAHFPTDAHGLGLFDGTALYEYAHPFEGFHQDWDTYIYNLGRNEVHGFMLASALHWLRVYHVDALRVDAVASMLYRDYSRKQGEWIPNQYGGRENLEAIAFLRHLNDVVSTELPGAMVIAEESTAWPGVSRPARDGGLGFTYKWNMGWMHDSLKYVSEDPLYRSYHYHQLTFGLLYAFYENFILPISHDEVVHGKGSLINKMPGDHWQKFANLRLYFSFMWTHPGKKLLFMGCEFAQWREWNHDEQLDWHLLDHPAHRGVQLLLKDVNHLYRNEPAMHQRDHRREGFQWLIGDDSSNSVYAWLRWGENGEPLLVIHNFIPVPRADYRVGVPIPGAWRVLLNSDANCYGGSNYGPAAAFAIDAPHHGEAYSLQLDLPPLATLILKPAR
jgi:1,4-alpha-glucan branching enzyme